VRHLNQSFEQQLFQGRIMGILLPSK